MLKLFLLYIHTYRVLRKICSKHFENEDFVGGLEAKMMNKPFQPFRRILIKNAVPTLFLPERYVPRPKHHVEQFVTFDMASGLPQPDVIPQDEIDEDLRDLEDKQV